MSYVGSGDRASGRGDVLHVYLDPGAAEQGLFGTIRDEPESGPFGSKPSEAELDLAEKQLAEQAAYYRS